MACVSVVAGFFLPPERACPHIPLTRHTHEDREPGIVIVGFYPRHPPPPLLRGGITPAGGCVELVPGGVFLALDDVRAFPLILASLCLNGMAKPTTRVLCVQTSCVGTVLPPFFVLRTQHDQSLRTDWSLTVVRHFCIELPYIFVSVPLAFHLASSHLVLFHLTAASRVQSPSVRDKPIGVSTNSIHFPCPYEGTSMRPRIVGLLPGVFRLPFHVSSFSSFSLDKSVAFGCRWRGPLFRGMHLLRRREGVVGFLLLRFWLSCV